MHIEQLISEIENENIILNEKILNLENDIERFLINKVIQNERKNEDNYYKCNFSNKNNCNLNENELCNLLYSFYSKVTKILNKSIIDLDSLLCHKNMFIISTSSMITEIKTYQLMLQKTTFNNYIKK